ncbi:MAG: response regulator transcription factor [Pontibacterium sp.]
MPDAAFAPVDLETRNVQLISQQTKLIDEITALLPSAIEFYTQTEPVLPKRSPALASSLLLLDCGSIGWPTSLALLSEAQSERPRSRVALINVAEPQDVSEALKWPVLSGIFTQQMGTVLLDKGLRELIAGRYWFSREQMNQLAGFRQAPKAQGRQPAEALSPRELEVLDLTSQGNSNAEIAKELFLSQHTVKTHLYNLYRKLGVVNRTQAVHWYQENQ